MIKQKLEIEQTQTGRTNRLTRRQCEVLDKLGSVMASEGFRHLRVADIAERVGCSLTLLYGIAKSRDELLFIALTRWYSESGDRTSKVDPKASCLDLLMQVAEELAELANPVSRQYLNDIAETPWARQLVDDSERRDLERLKVAIKRGLERGEVPTVDPELAATTFHFVLKLSMEGQIRVAGDAPLAESVKRAAAVVLRGLSLPEA